MTGMKALVTSRPALVGLVFLLFGGIASAQTVSTGSLEIGTPWARATPKGATVGAGYMTITNKGTETDRLVGGSAVPASRLEVHTTVMESDVARMRQVKSIEIKPGETVEFRPGGLHVMFMGLKQPLIQGQTLKGTLVFERAGTVAVEFTIQGAGAPGSGHNGHQGHGGHGGH
jgi:hypothetical protein